MFRYATERIVGILEETGKGSYRLCNSAHLDLWHPLLYPTHPGTSCNATCNEWCTWQARLIQEQQAVQEIRQALSQSSQEAQELRSDLQEGKSAAEATEQALQRQITSLQVCAPPVSGRHQCATVLRAAASSSEWSHEPPTHPHNPFNAT